MPKSDPADLTQLLHARRKQKEEIVSPAPVPVEMKKVGRPPGRRSDPTCTSLTLLIKEDIIAEAQYKLRLLNKGKSPKKSLSELVEELLQDWLEEA